MQVLKEQVELRPGIQQLDKKNVVLHDVNNVPIQLYFDTSKDAKCFVDSERLNSPLGEKSSIKTKLLRLLGKRSSREFLVEKGIYMNESIFGNTIQSIYQMHDCVPEFLTKSIQLIEMPTNISQVRNKWINKLSALSTCLGNCITDAWREISNLIPSILSKRN